MLKPRSFYCFCVAMNLQQKIIYMLKIKFQTAYEKMQEITFLYPIVQFWDHREIVVRYKLLSLIFLSLLPEYWRIIHCTDSGYCWYVETKADFPNKEGKTKSVGSHSFIHLFTHPYKVLVYSCHNARLWKFINKLYTLLVL